MKRISSHKLRIGISIFAYQKDKVINRVTRQSKKQIIKELEIVLSSELPTKLFLSVNYGKKIGKNESDHTNKESLLNALNAYTEKPMIDFICQE